jgi:uncharacterized membrane-anchored protein YhcB (DUF1043 family)
MARKKTSRKSYTRSNSRTRSKSKKVVKRKKSKRQTRQIRQTKRGGMEGPWNFEAMNPQGFGQPQESALPTGPLTECQTLECKKRRAESALEQVKEELEEITTQLQDARAREQLNSLLIPLNKAYGEISNMVTSSASSVAGDVRRRSGELGKIVSKQISKRVVTPVAKRAKRRFAPGTPGYLALQQLEDSSERFGR